MQVVPTKVIFVASSNYSGTTLFSVLMGMHPAVATVGEMTGLIETVNSALYKCSCGEPIANCQFWVRVREEMRIRGEHFNVGQFGLKFFIGSRRSSQVLLSRSLHNGVLNSIRDYLAAQLHGVRVAKQKLQERNRAFIESVLAITGKSVFLDASKDPIRMKYLAQTPGLDLYLVHLVRDVRGTANSYKKHFAATAIEGAKNWRWVHRDIERFKREIPSARQITVRYEDFCAAPEIEAKRIERWSGLDSWWGGNLFDTGLQHLVGNEMRTQGRGRITLDEKWRTELTRQEQISVMRIAGNLCRSYGYLD